MQFWHDLGVIRYFGDACDVYDRAKKLSEAVSAAINHQKDLRVGSESKDAFARDVDSRDHLLHVSTIRAADLNFSESKHMLISLGVSPSDADHALRVSAEEAHSNQVNVCLCSSEWADDLSFFSAVQLSMALEGMLHQLHDAYLLWSRRQGANLGTHFRRQFRLTKCS
jgi:hypothetical protein